MIVSPEKVHHTKKECYWMWNNHFTRQEGGANGHYFHQQRSITAGTGLYCPCGPSPTALGMWWALSRACGASGWRNGCLESTFFPERVDDWEG